MRWRVLVLLAASAWTAPVHSQLTQPATVRVHVLSLFHPHDLVLYPPAHGVLNLVVDAHGRLIERVSQPVRIHANGRSLEIAIGEGHLTGTELSMSSTQAFEVAVPGKLRRNYVGVLTIGIASGGVLQPVVTMPVELAVASIVAAESPPRAPLEALKAQAIASRSYLLANLVPARAFDATDTTHDQFLRSPPALASPASKAAQATTGLVLTWQAETGAPMQIVTAMYSRSCSGTTRTLHDIGRSSTGAYPFHAVRCPYHAVHPDRWTREDPGTEVKTEEQRLAWNRTHGWSAIPSAPEGREGSTVTGRGTGHGVGLCQMGAAEMAAGGANVERILAHFYPDTTVRRLH